jgi:ribose 5-phosphate isomerase B
MTQSIGIAADHGGFVIKTGLVAWLKSEGYEVIDLGANVFESGDDYPDYAEKLARVVACGKIERGILVCGSGVGASIAANKIPGIRACLCHDTYSAHQGVEHDNMNVLCLGGRVLGLEMAKELAKAFLKANFIDEERFKRRLAKILQIENEVSKSNISKDRE